MKISRTGFLVAGFLMASALMALAHEVPIETPTEFFVEAGKVVERPIALVFDDFYLLIRDRQSRKDLTKLIYEDITSIQYENATQPQVLGSQAIPSPEEKRHWLTFHYTHDGETAFLLLSLDGYDYEPILKITAMLTGKAVEGAPEE